jgi:hypothetical protein
VSLTLHKLEILLFDGNMLDKLNDMYRHKVLVELCPLHFIISGFG